METPVIHLDQAQTKALEEAVARGEVASIEEGVAAAIDAWVTEQAFQRTDDAMLQKLCREGEESGALQPLDVNALKAEAKCAL